MKLAILVLIMLSVGCGSKAKTAPTPPAAGSAASAQCCCTIPNSQAKLLAPDACKTGGGTCEATEDSCHGIEGPIP